MTDILIVEDNSELGTLIRDLLSREGYSVELLENGERAILRLKEEDYKLMLLDVMLPGLDGFETLRLLRKEQDIPVIMMSAKDDDDSKILGLDVGADDYIEKPYDIDILIAKIKGIFKRRYQKDILSADGVTLNLVEHSASIDDTPVTLTAKEFDLLALLVENQGKAMKKEYLFSTVWGSDSDSEIQTLHVHINRLRSKLGEDPKNAKRLLTVWGVGYKFV